MAFAHAADDITLGRGEIYFFPFLTGTTTPSKDGRYLGNTPGFNLAANVERLEHFSSDRGLKVKDRNVTLSVDYTGTMECDNINVENLALFFMGDGSTFTQGALSAQTETFAANTLTAGAYIQLGVTDANPQGHRNVTVSGVTLNAVAITLGTDYEVDAAAGMVHLLGGVTQTELGQALVVTYDVASSTRDRVVSAGTEAKGALKLLSFSPEGTKRDYLLPSVTISPNGDFALKGDDWQVMSFNLEVLAKNATTAAVYVDGRPA